MKSPSPITRRASASLACLLIAAYVLPGCGGHSRSASAMAKGNLKFTVVWPQPQPSLSRVIPTNAQSLLVSVTDASGTTQSQVILRPASTASFTELAVGTVSVTATAFANTTGTGTPLATATVSSAITNNSTSSVDVTMASTIDHLTVTPSPYTLAALASGSINVVAYDSGGAVVLLDPSTLSFASSNAAVVAVNSSGVATAGGSVGSATITISQSDSGKSLSLPVSIVPAVSVTPSAPTVTLRGTATFVATVVGPVNTSVTWSVQEGAAGGSITAGGIYTAPATHGTYHVIATSVADTSRTATATITVSSGSIGVTVH